MIEHDRNQKKKMKSKEKSTKLGFVLFREEKNFKKSEGFYTNKGLEINLSAIVGSLQKLLHLGAGSDASWVGAGAGVANSQLAATSGSFSKNSVSSMMPPSRPNAESWEYPASHCSSRRILGASERQPARRRYCPARPTRFRDRSVSCSCFAVASLALYRIT